MVETMNEEQVEKIASVIEHALQSSQYFTSLYNGRSKDASWALRDAARAAIAALGDGWQNVASARAAALEEAAVIAETWFDHHRPQQPKKSRFDIYDIQNWAKTATKLVAEDIRARAALAQGGEP
jgi:hypothetical protein